MKLLSEFTHLEYLEIYLSTQKDDLLSFMDLFSELSPQQDDWLFFMDLISTYSVHLVIL